MECGWEQKDNEEEEERKPEGVRCSNSVCKYAVMIANAPPPHRYYAMQGICTYITKQLLCCLCLLGLSLIGKLTDCVPVHCLTLNVAGEAVSHSDL